VIGTTRSSGNSANGLSYRGSSCGVERRLIERFVTSPRTLPLVVGHPLEPGLLQVVPARVLPAIGRRRELQHGELADGHAGPLGESLQRAAQTRGHTVQGETRPVPHRRDKVVPALLLGGPDVVPGQRWQAEHLVQRRHRFGEQVRALGEPVEHGSQQRASPAGPDPAVVRPVAVPRRRPPRRLRLGGGQVLGEDHAQPLSARGEHVVAGVDGAGAQDAAGEPERD